MKRFILLLITLSFSYNLLFSSSYASEKPKNITVFVDGLQVKFDTEPIINKGYTMVPFRILAKALDINVEWDSSKQTVNAKNDNNSVQLTVGKKTAYYNGNTVSLDTPPINLGGRVLIPLRFFSESFSCKVQWDNVLNSIKIKSPKKAMSIIGFYALGDNNTSSWKGLFGKTYPEMDNGNTDEISEVALGWYSLDEQGNLTTQSKTGWKRPDGWENVLDAVKKYNIEPEMLLNATDKDGFLIKLLNNKSAVENAINLIAQEAYIYKGVNLDFEGLGLNENELQLSETRNAFNTFITKLYTRLKQDNIRLTLSLHAPNSSYKGYDYKTLGENCDRIIIMAYEYGTIPEPESLVEHAVEMALEQVPPEKLILGISAPSETNNSISTKVGVAKKYGLKGIAIWRLGLITQEMWTELRECVIKIS